MKAIATNAQDGNPPIEFKTATRVASVDPADASVILQDGTRFSGDVVIGADGVHSVTRKAVPGGHVEAFSSGKSAFRFLVPKQAALDDPFTADLVKNDGELCIWYGSDRRVVMYPTSNNSLLNFVAIHPEAESADETDGDTWGKNSNSERMLHIFSSFDPALLKLLAKADPETVKVWNLLDMEKMPKWNQGKLALLGDAAHPFLPHQGQGAGVAIEDAASLSVVLPLGAPVTEIPERLELYNKIRYERAHQIQEFSRLIGQDKTEDRKSLDSKLLICLFFKHISHN